MSESWQSEVQAYQSLNELFKQAEQCRLLFEKARLPLPDPLKRVLGVNGSGSAAKPKGGITAPERPLLPVGAKEEWVCLPIASGQSQTVALAILRKEGRPMRPKELADKVTGSLPNVSMGGIYNLGIRLEGRLIRKTDEGWELMAPDETAILESGMLWGPKSIFSSQELAAHRRHGILHILKFFASGLQTVQITDELRKCEWMRAPVTKDLVKADMEQLQAEGRVRRRGNSKKWELVPTEA